MNERLRELRKALGLTQSGFGERLGLRGNTITNYENGLRSISDSVVLSIVREFGCDEKWLRTGEGAMFPDLTWQKKVAAYVGKVLTEQGAGAEIQQMALDFFSEVPPELWQELGERARIVIERHYPKK